MAFSCSFLFQDAVLSDLLDTCKDQIVSFHEHESLLDHKEEEELSEAERKVAWAEYEAEVNAPHYYFVQLLSVKHIKSKHLLYVSV